MASRGSDAWRHEFWGAPCKPLMRSVQLGRAKLKVDHRIVASVAALDAILVQKYGYDVHPAYPDGDTGAYNCRHIGNDSGRPWSSHAWATAIDINWNSNPDGSRLRTDIPRAAIDDIHKIVTNSGAPVWRWGGDWDRDPRTDHSYYDAMHFEIHATPAELVTGIKGQTPDMTPEQEAKLDKVLALLVGERGWDGIHRIAKALYLQTTNPDGTKKLEEHLNVIHRMIRDLNDRLTALSGAHTHES